MSRLCGENEDLLDEWQEERMFEERRAMPSKALAECDAVAFALVRSRAPIGVTWSFRLAVLDAALVQRLVQS